MGVSREVLEEPVLPKRYPGSELGQAGEVAPCRGLRVVGSALYPPADEDFPRACGPLC